MNNLEAMRFLGRCLVPGQDDVSGELAARIRSGEADWKRLMLIATGHYLAPSLCEALKRRGLWELAPAEIREILQAMHMLNRERNDLHFRELITITNRLNSMGVEPLLLKGAICLLLPGQFPGAGSRVISDLDLLLPNGRAEEMLGSMVELGYAHDPNMDLDWFKDHFHLPPLYHPENGVRLELHTGLCRRRDKPVLDIRRIWRNARPVEFSGACALVPDHYSRMLHNVVHARLQHRHHSDYKLEMRQLNEWVQLSEIHEHEPDWLRMWNQFDRYGEAPVLEAYCLAAKRFFGQPMPDGVKPSRAAIRAERIMCLALRGPVPSFLLSTVKKKLRSALTPSTYLHEYRKIRSAWLQKKRPPGV